jgi:hypothetical protein
MNTAKIEHEINSYLPSLNLKQKKAVLKVVKTFAESQDDSGYTEEFKRELDSRYEGYLNGGELLTEEEVKKGIEEIIKGKRRK